MNRTAVCSFFAITMAMFLTAQASAATIYEADFNEAAFAAGGLLQFKDGWLGQDNATVDPNGSGNIEATGAFFRNLQRFGSRGSLAGGGGGDATGPGFNAGDKIAISMEYQFTLDGRFNRPLDRTGLRNCFSTCGFDASPQIGMKSFYSEFSSASGGSLKLFGSLGRNGFSGADNAFALIAQGTDIGLDPDGANGPVDLDSDVLRYDLELTYLGADQWQTSALTLSNVTAGNIVLKDAAVDNPTILTEVQTQAANDFYLASAWTDSNLTVRIDSISHNFAGVPEPSSIALLALAGLGTLIRRR